MADTKISALTSDTAPTSDDLIVTVNDPAGSPANKRVTLGDAITKASGLSGAYVKASGAALTAGAIAAGDIPSLTHTIISDFDAQVRTSTLNQMTAPTADLSINSHKLTSVTDPTSAQDAATKSYVDAVASGLSVKSSVRLATTAALPSLVYANGSSGVGATLTGAGVGVLTIDGVAVAASDRLVVKDQSSGLQNGIYTCTVAGAVATAFILTRATDSDTSAKLVGGFVFVEEGTTNANSGFVNTNTGTVTIGTTAITYTQFSGAGEITAGTGLSKSGNTLNLADTVVTPGAYTSTSLTVDAQGRITAASSGAGGGGGQTLVTKVVAASGGDYTTLGAALAAASNGWVIWLKPGTYTESAISSTLNNITIVGFGATVALGTNDFSVSTGTGWRVEGVTFTSSTGSISFSANTNLRFVRNEIVSSGNAIHTISGDGSICAGNRINLSSTDTGNIHLTVSGSNIRVSDNSFTANPTKTNGVIELQATNGSIAGNTFTTNSTGSAALVRLNANYMTFSGNTLQDTLGITSLLRNDGGVAAITGNNLQGSGTTNVINDTGGSSSISGNFIRTTNSAGIGINSGGASNVITGNRLFMTAGGSSVGINVSSGSNVVSGNYMSNAVTGVVIAGGTNSVVTSNKATGSSTVLSDAGTTTSTNNNVS